MRPSDGLEDDALEALLVLAFLEDPPPDPGAEIPAAPPWGDFDGQAAVQEHRAAAHAGGDTALLQAVAGEPGQDVADVGEDVAHDADHLDVEPFGLGAGEDGQAVAALATLDLGDRDRGQRAGRNGLRIVRGSVRRRRRDGRRQQSRGHQQGQARREVNL